jgi:hypothetical protein
MGLDQKWYWIEESKEEKLERIITGGDPPDPNQFGYNRKFWDLQHFLNTENYTDLIITWDHYADLVDWVEKHRLVDDYESHHYSYLEHKILPQIKEHLEQGNTVIYCADW